MKRPRIENILLAVNNRRKEKMNPYKKSHVTILKAWEKLAWVQFSPEVAVRRG
jgi:hypothetical protein